MRARAASIASSISIQMRPTELDPELLLSDMAPSPRTPKLLLLQNAVMGLRRPVESSATASWGSVLDTRLAYPHPRGARSGGISEI